MQLYVAKNNHLFCLQVKVIRVFVLKNDGLNILCFQTISLFKQLYVILALEKTLSEEADIAGIPR